MYITIGTTENCINPSTNSEDGICLRCNGCGRFNEDTRIECAMKVYQNKLEEADEWVNDLQERLGYALEEQEYWQHKIEELEK